MINKEITEAEAEEKVIQHRHTEIKRALEEIINVVQKDKDMFVSAFKKQSVAVEKFTEIVQGIPKSNILDINHKNIVLLIEKLCKAIIDSQLELKELIKEDIKEVKRLKEWHFTFDEDDEGIIVSATAKQIK